MSRHRLLAFFAMRPRQIFAVATFSIPLFLPVIAAATTCVLPDSGGTVVLPPAGCGYVSPTDVHMIINGLPAGTTIKIGVEHQRFFLPKRTPGGSLGGEVEQFQSSLHLTMTGTGSPTQPYP